MEEIPWDGYIQLFSTFFSLTIAWYGFRLTRFFRGGIFYGPFRFFGPAFLTYAFGSFIDAFPELNLGPEWFHMIHFISYSFFFASVTYSFRLFYKACERMCMRAV